MALVAAVPSNALPAAPSAAAAAKWSWALRGVEPGTLNVDPQPHGPPAVGDLALVRVERIGYHSSIVTVDNRKLRIYPGDLLVGVFGNRYATDAFEAEVRGTEPLHLLTAGGMVGTVLSAHRDMGKPTELSFLGYLTARTGERRNLRDARSASPLAPGATRNLIVVVGTGMNAGKTTVASRLTRHLVRSGLTVAAGKLTGSVSNRDADEMRAAGACRVLDFSDYGFPSTYLASPVDLLALREQMIADLSRVGPDVLVLEIADGILQRETALLLADPAFREQIRGVVLAADGALSALYAVELLRRTGHEVLAVSGALTSSPLFVREFRERCPVPVASSAGEGEDIARIVLPHLEAPSHVVGLDDELASLGEAVASTSARLPAWPS